MTEVLKPSPWRRVVACGMSAVLAFGLSPLAQAPAAYADQGQGLAAASVQPLDEGEQTGEVTWALNDGVLTISGIGAMESSIADTEHGVAPWLSSDAYNEYESWTATTGIVEVVIEEGVTSIAPSAFRSITSLQKVTIPSTVTYIGAAAFRGCESLESVNVPGTVKKIGANAFYQCKNMTEATLGEGLESIGSGAFSESGVTAISIPESAAFDSGAFKACTALESVTLPSSLVEISSSAFFGCTKLTAVVIPENVANVGDYAFQKCTNLETVTFESLDTTFGTASFDGTAFLDGMGDWSIINGRLLQYKGLAEGELTVPDTVTSIDASATKTTNDKVTKLVIPASVKKIGSFAFEKLTNLETVVMQAEKAPVVGMNAFGAPDVDKLAIIIPEGATGYNLTEITGEYPNWNYWSLYYNEGCVGTEAEIAALREQRAAAKEAAQEASDAIQALPTVANVTLLDKDEIDAAQAKYDALTEVGKGMVSDSLKTKLANVSARIAELVEAQKKEGVAIDEALFPDAALREKILSSYDPDQNGKLSPDEIAGTSKLELAGGSAKIKNLAGIEVFTSLKELYVSGNALAAIDLSKLTKLTTLDVRNNALTALNVSGLEGLTKLYAGGNKLTALDVSANEDLMQLEAANNKLTGINLSANEYLTALDLSGNQIVAFDAGDLSLSTFKASGQTRVASYVGSTFDLKTLDSAIAAKSISNVSGAKISGTKLTGLGKSATVSYSYACGDDLSLGVTLSLTLDTAADAVVTKIAALPKKANLKLADATKVAAARAAYDKLAKAQKALVTNYSTLTADESQVKSLKDADVKAAKNQSLTGGKASVSKAYGAKAFALGVKSSYAGAKLTYKSSNPKVAAVDGSGKVTVKAPGTATVTATATAKPSDGKTYTKTFTTKVTVTLAKPALTGATKSAKAGKLTAAWGKVSGAQGYQLKVGSKTYTVSASSKAVSAAKGAKVKVQVRAYSKASGSMVYSAWSAAKTVTVKKK